MNYKKIYDDLISSRVKLRGTKKKRNDGFDRHHIVPRCMGGKDEDSNYVLLTYREHCIAHILLTRIYPEEKGLVCAIYLMLSCKNKSYSNLNELSRIRDEAIEYKRQLQIGVPLSDKHKKKLSEAHKGMTYSDETKALLSSIRKGHEVRQETRDKISEKRLGITFSEEHKKKLSEKRKQKKLSNSAKAAISGENSQWSRKIQGPDGTIYNTVGEAYKAAGVTENTLRSWIQKGDKGYKYLTPRFEPKAVIGPDGKEYSSMKAAAKAIGRAKSTIKRWIEKFPQMGWKYK